MFCTTSPISCMILHMPCLSTANENSHTCVTLSVDSEYGRIFDLAINFDWLTYLENGKEPA